MRSLLAMHVVMPLVALALVAPFHFHPALKIGLVALAVSPVPPILPRKQLKEGGHTSYVVGLLTATSVLAIVLVPVTVDVLGQVFATHTRIPIATVASVVAVTVLLPLTAGISVRAIAPSVANRIAGPIAMVAMLLLLLGAVLIAVSAWHAAAALVGNGHVLVLVAFVGIGLAVGHALGGPDPEDRTTLALSTGSRHPGMAMAIAHATFPEQTLVVGAVLLYLVASSVMSIPYLAWRHRRLGPTPHPVRT